jgi:prolyl 4-hydroxylase
MNQEIHNNDPLVLTIDNCLTVDECNHMIQISKPKMARSLVSNNKEGVESASRTSLNAWIQHDYDEITLRIGKKIANIVGIPLENAEAYQVLHYDINGEYRNHYDSWEHDGSEKTLRCMKYGGARLKTALVYLNDVEEGGSTRLNRLNIDVLPKQGKLLIFENTYVGTNKKHPLSEHAGMPVIKGEKYAFNLWFKEFNAKRLYSDFNPGYYNTTVEASNTSSINSIETTSTNIETTSNNIETTSTNIETTSTNIETFYKYTHLSKLTSPFIKVTDKKNIYKFEDFISESECKQIINSCDFTKSSSKYINCWLYNNKFQGLIHKIEKYTGIKSSFFENMNVFKYSPNQVHGPFMEAYDITSENGKKYTEKLGQRIFTITVPLSNVIDTKFTRISETISCKIGTLLIYDNILHTSRNIRDTGLEHSIYNNNATESYFLNIYIREKDAMNNSLSVDEIKNIKSSDISLTRQDTVGNSEKNMENYMETFESVLKKFKTDKIPIGWHGENSFNYILKGEFDYFKNTVLEYINSREQSIIEVINGESIEINSDANNSALNYANLQKSYMFDEYNPVVVENVLNPKTLAICQKYYSTNIENGAYVLGDKQSQRFKSHNEPLSRILHYEVLPLAEKIVGKKLMPTYTYLSAYVKGSDLPAHTDRPDCEYTVSFLINKPENSHWPIYVHKVKQPVKHKGRSDFTPPKEECITVDCNAGGLMIFQGTDHIHFRENLPDDFYHIVLLHYVTYK